MIRTTVICLLTFTNICFAQTGNFKCKPCNTEGISIENHLTSIDEKELYCFINNFSKSDCKNNAEYMEFANPLLFDILQHNSRALIDIIIKYPALNKKYVHNEIKNPLLDYNIKRIIFAVDSSNKKSSVKRQILADLSQIKTD